MSIPTYEEFIGGKKLTMKQHRRQREKYKELHGVNITDGGKIESRMDVEKEEDKEGRVPAKAGQCEKCYNGGFSLRIKNGDFVRSCMKCGHEKVV